MSERMRQLLPAAGVFAFALLVRLIYLYDISDAPAFRIPILDSQNYDIHARQLADGRGFNPDMFWQPILYPVALAGVYAPADGSILAARIAQALLGAATCGLVFVLGKHILDKRIGLLAATVTALYGPLIFHESELLANVWAEFWSVLLILLVLRVESKRSLSTGATLGLCGGLAVITRPTIALFLACVCMWLVVRFCRTGGPAAAFRLLGVALAGFLIVTLPAALLTSSVTGRFTVLPANGAINFWMGNNHDAEQTEATLPWDMIRLRRVAAENGSPGLWGESSYYSALARRYITSDPVSFVKGLGRKTLQYAASREIPSYEDVYLARRWSRLLTVLVWKAGPFGFPFGLLLPLGLLGLLRLRARLTAPLILFLACEAASVILVHVMARYRIVAIPAFSVAASAGCVALVDMVRSRRWGSLTAAVAGMTAVVAVATLPGPFRLESVNTEAEMRLSMGYYHQTRSRNPVAALDEYREATRLEPENPAAHFNAALALSALGRVPEAVEEYDQAIRLRPRYPEFRFNQANSLLALKRLDEAEQQYLAVLRLDPGSAQAHYNLAYLLTDAGRIDAAIEHYRAALRAQPDFADAAANLAMLLDQTRNQTAAAAYEHAIRLSPRNSSLHCRLGDVLLGSGDVPGAAARYRQALQLDPRNTHAINRLMDIRTGRVPTTAAP